MIPSPGARANVPPATPSTRVVAESVDHAAPVNGLSPPAASDEEAGVSWPDDTAESSYLAEARERGEMTATAAPKVEEKEDTDPKALPSLDELVERIPPGVREVLDDLFRAKFTKVRRIPRSALKG